MHRNLIFYDVSFRRPELWVDESPPEKDLELGVGRYIAWQHRYIEKLLGRYLRFLSSLR